MNINPSISLVAWEERKGNFVFVSVPDEPARYLRTDKSVVLVACSQCGSVIGEPCKGSFEQYVGATHYDRRNSVRWSNDISRADRRNADDKINKPKFKLLKENQ